MSKRRRGIAAAFAAACALAACTDAPDPVVDAVVAERITPASVGLGPDDAERELDVPALFRSAYHRDVDFEIRYSAREQVRNLSADDAIPHLIRIGSTIEWKWESRDAVRDIGSFREAARPWLDDIAELIGHETRAACDVLLIFLDGGLRPVLDATRGAHAGHQMCALDALAASPRNEPQILSAGVRQLRSPAEKVSRAAARLVVAYFVRSGESLRSVDRALRASDVTRTETLLALSRYGDRAAGVAPLLIERLRDGERYAHAERMRAAEVLVGMESLRDATLDELRQAVVREPDELFGLARAIASLDPDSFVAGLSSDAAAVRRAHAWSAYPEDVAPEVRPVIRAALVDLLARADGDRDGDMRGVAALALTRFADLPDTAVAPLTRLVRAREAHARWRVVAVHALARGGVPAQDALRRIVDDQSLPLSIRERAADLL